MTIEKIPPFALLQMKRKFSSDSDPAAPPAPPPSLIRTSNQPLTVSATPISTAADPPPESAPPFPLPPIPVSAADPPPESVTPPATTSQLSSSAGDNFTEVTPPPLSEASGGADSDAASTAANAASTSAIMRCCFCSQVGNENLPLQEASCGHFYHPICSLNKLICPRCQNIM